MQTLEPPLDISFASDGELYNESKSVFCVETCLKFSVNIYKNVSGNIRYSLSLPCFPSLLWPTCLTGTVGATTPSSPLLW